MHHNSIRRPYVVVVKSSRQTAQKQEHSALWNNVDLAAAQERVSRDMDEEAGFQPHTTISKMKTNFNIGRK